MHKVEDDDQNEEVEPEVVEDDSEDSDEPEEVSSYTTRQWGNCLGRFATHNIAPAGP